MEPVLFGDRTFWEVEVGCGVGCQKLLVHVLAESQVRIGDVGAIVVVECAGTDVFVGQTLAWYISLPQEHIVI